MNVWFQEDDTSGLRFSYKVKDVLHSEKSEYQKIAVIDTEAYGRMLLLDDLVMCTEKDEFVYHEMIAHVPLFLHGNVKDVLVIGGGDGGTVRELVKHQDITSVTLCEIDGRVVETSKKYFPKISSGYSDPRVKVSICDGVEFVATSANAVFDMVIVDSTDPIGPGEGLFTKEFYSNVARILRRDGVMVCQSESPWYEGEMLKRISTNIKGGFSYLKPYLAAIPTYPRGYWSFTIGSNRLLDPREANFDPIDNLGELHYLNSEVAVGSFALPNFYKNKLD